jgi:glycosyltransferase involved in cell wall biosynthesis
VEYRRLSDIFDLIRILPDHINNQVQFYINAPITDNEYFQYCENKYSDVFKRENVVIDIIPFRSDEEMYAVYLSSEIFIFPNEKQTWGHAPLEAMACLCMVIVSEGCGIHEVVKGISNTTYPTGDIKSLLSILTTVIENKKYKEIAAEQRKYVADNLTWPVICSQFINDFKSIINV